MSSSGKAGCVKRAIIALFSIYAIEEVWRGRDILAEGFGRLDDAHGAGLNHGMQIIMLLLILYLCLLAVKNLFEIVVICKKAKEDALPDNCGGQLTEYMEKARIVLGFAPVQMIFVLLMSIALYGMYMTFVGRAGNEMYGVGLFFIAVAGWGFFLRPARFYDY